ncbi:unnamed protein product [Sympodiomycopsis kandeliae]
MNTSSGSADAIIHSWTESAHIPSHPFSEYFPPPYRVLLLLSIGVLGWALNLDGLARLGIDTEEILSSGKPAQRQQPRGQETRSTRDGDPPLPLYDSANTSNSKYGVDVTRPASVYAISALLAAWTLFNWAFFRSYVSRYEGDPSGRHAQALQGIAILAVIIAVIWPGNVLWKGRRKQFGKALVPLFHPTHLLKRAPTFPSILLADILTSFAKVFGDVWLTACFLVPRKEHHTWWNGRGSWMVPLLVSLPYGIRFFQCVAEYQYSQNTIHLTDAVTFNPSRLNSKNTKGRAKRPLANALKYASAFPVIWISASQSARAGAGVPDSEQGSNPWWSVWLLSVMVNSLFSFWWDVTNDWGLEIMKPSTWKSAKSIMLSTPIRSRSVSGASATSGGATSFHRRGLSVWPAPRGEEEEEGQASNGHGAYSDERHSDDDEEDSSHKDHLLRKSTNGFLGASSAGTHARSLSRLILRTNSPSSSRKPQSQEQPSMLFSPSIYHFAILLDLVLRFTWSLKLSSHLNELIELESGIFILEVLEILRRTGWVFLRIEWEVVKRFRANEILSLNGIQDRVQDGGADHLLGSQ